jgi:hypothetical protein
MGGHRSVTSGAAEARWISTPPDDPASKAGFLERNKCRLPLASGARAKKMLISEDYRQLAERCLKLAGECSDPLMADALRALATDYLTRANGPAGRRRALSWE